MTCHLLYWYFNFDCIFLYTYAVHVDSIYPYMVEYGKKKQFEKKIQNKNHIYFKKKGITKQSKQFVDKFFQSLA